MYFIEGLISHQINKYQDVCSSTARHAESIAALTYAYASESEFAIEIFPNCARPISCGAFPSSHSGSYKDEYS